MRKVLLLIVCCALIWQPERMHHFHERIIQ